MRPECKASVEESLGRPLRPNEAATIDAQLRTAMTQVARTAPRVWRTLPMGERLNVAARFAAQSLRDEARREGAGARRFRQDDLPDPFGADRRRPRDRGRIGPDQIKPSILDQIPGDGEYEATLARLTLREQELGTPGLPVDEARFMRRHRAWERGDAFPQAGERGPRGEIAFPEAGARGALIRLTEAADASTFFHEAGHFILELMGDLAARADAPPALRADYEAALTWLGVSTRADIATPQHERFARGLETYLMEGRAPSPGLASLFRMVSDWLKDIYKALTALDAPLSDDIRAVFDRLFQETQDEPGQRAGGVRGSDGQAVRSGGGDTGVRSGGAGADRSDAGGGDRAGAGAIRADRTAPGAAAAAGGQRTGRFDPLADPELQALAADLDAARAELDTLSQQGRLTPAEIEQARADLEPDPRRALRVEALRAATFCLQFGSR